jgi:ABC-type glycerol-3-phosphate transport system permease component
MGAITRKPLRFPNPSALVGFIFIAVVCLFAIFPFYVMLKSALQPYADIMSTRLKLVPANWLYVDNFVHLFRDHLVLKWLLNSFFVTGVATLANLVFDVAAAFALARIPFRGRTAVFVTIVATLMIPIQIIIVPLYVFMVRLGWVNNYWGLIVPNLISPFGIFFLRQSLMMIPKELDEAAIVDGAGRLRVMTSIVLPNAISAVGTIATIKFMWVWGDYIWPSLVIKSESLRTLPVGIALLESASGTIPWDLVMTASLVSVVPIVGLFLYFQKYFVSGLTEGAVKG